MAVQPSAEDVLLLKNRVFLAAKNNQPRVIQDCLASLHPDVVKDVLHHCSLRVGFQSTPLIVASSMGHVEVVELLVSRFYVNVNQEVSWNDCGFNALFSAVCCGHLDIVKMLVNSGCDISAATRNGIQAVYIACHRNHLDVLKYLVEHGAPIDYHGVQTFPTCLMIACRNGSQEIVEYLLSKGADPNKEDAIGGTALGEAAKRGASDIIRLLLQHGARLSKDRNCSSPSIVAAMKPSGNSVHVPSKATNSSNLERIEALEQLGARLAPTNINEAFMFVRQAMEERHKNPNAVLLKPHSNLPTLSNVLESQTLEELQARQSDHHLFRLECLAIMGRYLGPDDVQTVQAFNVYSAELRSAGHYSEATAVLLHGTKAAVKCSKNPNMTRVLLLKLSSKFAQLLQNGTCAIFSDLAEIMECTLEMTEKNNQFSLETLADDYRWLSYISIALKVAQGQEEGRRLQRLTERFIRLSSGSLVLPTAVALNGVRPQFLRDLDDLPYELLVSFLLQCGADVHAKDGKKNTALHIVAYLSQKGEDSDLISRITRTLLDGGALVGMKNKEGQTPLDMAGPALAAELRKLYPVSLKSLAASAVVKHKIPFIGEVPEELAKFTEKH